MNCIEQSKKKILRAVNPLRKWNVWQVHLDRLSSNLCQTNRTLIEFCFLPRSVRKLYCHSICYSQFFFSLDHFEFSLGKQHHDDDIVSSLSVPISSFSWWLSPSLSFFLFCFVSCFIVLQSHFPCNSFDFIVLTKLLQVRIINGHARNVIEKMWGLQSIPFITNKQWIRVERAKGKKTNRKRTHTHEPNVESERLGARTRECTMNLRAHALHREQSA